MLQNYLRVAIRYLLKHRVYSLINILGLSIGMACCFLIILFIQNEFSYDRQHRQVDQIYRVLRETRTDGGRKRINQLTSGPLAAALKANFPEVQSAVRIMNRQGQWTRYEDKSFRQAICLVEQNVFDVLNFSWAQGNPKTVFEHPWSAVITEAVAQQYFGGGDPIGKTLVVEGRVYPGTYTITGVIKDIVPNSTHQFDVLHNTVPKDGPYRDVWEKWQDVSWREAQTFVVLPKGYDAKLLEAKLPSLMEQHMGAKVREKNTYYLQPFTRMRLYGRMDYGLQAGGNIAGLYVLGGIALFLLLIACINFTNLATARSATRAREVGMRKVVGAHRFQLVRQFLGESLFQALVSLVLAVCIAEFALPVFNGFMGSELSLFPNVWLGAGFLGFALAVGLLAGSYPAFFLSAYRPVTVLKGALGTRKRGSVFRKGLVVFQFAMSILMIIGTTVVYNQLAYMQNKDLGFDKEHIIYLPIFSVEAERKTESEAWLADRYQTVKHAFSQHPNVLKVSAFRFWMGWGGGMNRQIRAEGHEDQQWRMPVQEADEDFLNVFDIELLAGRNLNLAFATDSTSAFLINETASKMFGWDDPIGKSLQIGSHPGTVVGVFQDYHHGNLHEKIGPTAFRLRTRYLSSLALKVRSENVPETMAFLEKTWKQFLPEQPFEYRFIDENLGMIYRTERMIAQITGVFSLLSIFVACLGLLGLATFTAEQRTKEIGIRKVMGASVSNLVLLVSKEFVLLVVLANVIAWPVGYYFMDLFLQEFAYRTTLGVETFLFGGAIAFLIALVTVGTQAMKAARSNPVDALRYE